MIKREFIENNLLKVLNYLPEYIKDSEEQAWWYLKIEKEYGKYKITYFHNDVEYNCFDSNLFISINEDLIEAIIDIIKKLNTIIPNFINNLIDI